jgi:hypothetical protein
MHGVISAGNDAGAPDYARAFKMVYAGRSSRVWKDSQFNLAVSTRARHGHQGFPSWLRPVLVADAAAAQGDADAKTHAEVLAKLLPSDTVKSIEARIQSLSPEKAPDIANAVAVNDNSWKGDAGIAGVQLSLQPRRPWIGRPRPA